MMNLAEIAQRAAEHHRRGELQQAEQGYRTVLEHAPNEAGVRFDLAWLLYQRGDRAAGIGELRAAIATSPARAAFHSSLGIMLRAVGQAQEAVTSFQTALRLDPNNSETFYNLGNAYQQLGKFELSINCYRKALDAKPGDPEVLLNLGVSQTKSGQLAAARLTLQEAIVMQPNCSDAWTNLGVIAKKEEFVSEAVNCYQRALRINPANVLAHTNLAGIFESQGRYCEAVASYAEALRLAPSDTLKLRSALALPIIFESTQEIRRTRERLQQGLARLSQEPLRIDDPLQNLPVPLFYLAYHGDNDRKIQSQIAQLVRRVAPSLDFVAAHCLHPPEPPRDRPVKIGFVSTSLRAHTIGKLNRGLIRRLSRPQFEVVVFYFPHDDDVVTQAIADAADLVVDVPWDLAAARAKIAEYELDVLYYPDIGMEPMTYFLAHARLAPVQCVTWGHPLTTGIPTIDYFMSSEDLEPAGAETHYTEQLVRLPHLTNYYFKPVSPPATMTRTDFGLDAGTHIYMCPQSLFKLHPDNDAVFVGILARDPLARIVLLAGQEPTWAELLGRRFERTLGEHARRVHFVPRQDLPGFQQLLAMADVMLDPLHFGGGDTSYEGFAVGTPIVTLPGNFLRSRITYALYRTMGLSEYVATDVEDYIARAVRLGTDADWRQQVRDKILAANHAIYENQRAVDELEGFLLKAVESR